MPKFNSLSQAEILLSHLSRDEVDGGCLGCPAGDRAEAIQEVIALSAFSIAESLEKIAKNAELGKRSQEALKTLIEKSGVIPLVDAVGKSPL